jgi:DNA-binding transcriptional MerR regulator/methanogenic corrinoid protein MtbC1
MIDSEHQPKYNISTLAALAGVSPHCLRAWEKRYALIAPIRTEGGHRLYHDNDLKKLRHIAFLLTQGHLIGGLSRLSESELEAMAHHSGKYASDSSPGLPVSEKVKCDLGVSLVEQAPLVLSEWLEYGLKFDEVNLVKSLERMLAEHDVASVCLQLVGPFLRQLGENTCSGYMSLAHEHFISSSLRSVLGSWLLRRNPCSEQARGKMVVCTPSGELHEFGILVASMLAVEAGFAVKYLGPNMPVGDLIGVLNSQLVQVCLVGCSKVSLSHYSTSIYDYLSQIHLRWENPLGQIWLGGDKYMDARQLSWSPTRFRQCLTLEDFQFVLKNVAFEELSLNKQINTQNA